MNLLHEITNQDIHKCSCRYVLMNIISNIKELEI